MTPFGTVLGSLCLAIAILSSTTTTKAQSSLSEDARSFTIEERAVRDRLVSRVSANRATGYVKRFGRDAEDSFEIEDSLMKMLSRRHDEIDRARLDAAVDRIASRKADGLDVVEKRKLARSWFLLYELAKQELGSGTEGLDRLRVAVLLDPEEASYAKELEFQERRQEQIQARLDQAADLRAGIVRDHPQLKIAEGGEER